MLFSNSWQFYTLPAGLIYCSFDLNLFKLQAILFLCWVVFYCFVWSNWPFSLWHFVMSQQSTGVNKNTNEGRQPFNCSFWLCCIVCAVTPSWIAGTLEYNRAIVDDVSNTWIKMSAEKRATWLFKWSETCVFVIITSWENICF